MAVQDKEIHEPEPILFGQLISEKILSAKPCVDFDFDVFLECVQRILVHGTLGLGHF